MRTPGDRILWAGYARILRMLIDGPTSRVDLDVVRETGARILHQIHDSGLSHRCGWHVPPGSSARGRVPVYRFGPGEDAPWPGKGTPRPRKRQVAVELMSFIECVRLLMDDSRHCLGLAKESGLHPKTTRKIIDALRKQKLVYKAEYIAREIGGWGYPLYRWGPGKADRPKPPPTPKPVIWAKHNKLRAEARRQTKLQGAWMRSANDDQRSAA